MISIVRNADVGARLALLVIFFVNGLYLATWAVHIPTVQAAHGLSELALGGLLLAVATGALIAMPLAGAAVAFVGSRTMAGGGALVIAAALPVLITTDATVALFIAAALFGAGNGTMDVTMNANGVEVERTYTRRIMSTAHAMFSFGALAGAGIAAMLIALGLSALQHVVIMIVAGTFAIAVSYTAMHAPAEERAKRVFKLVWPTGPLLGLGIIAILTMSMESAIMDWSAVYLRRIFDATAEGGAIGYGAFALAMTFGRLAGDPLRARIAAAGLARISAGLAALGFAVAALAPTQEVAVFAMLLIGFGLSNMVPLLFLAAANRPGVSASQGIAAVSTAGYLGLLVAPALVGTSAELTGLRGAFIVLGLFGLIVLIACGRRRLGRHF